MSPLKEPEEDEYEIFEETRVKWVLKRMLPPGKIKYIFSNKSKVMIAKDHKRVEFNSRPIKIVTIFYTNFLTFKDL